MKDGNMMHPPNNGLLTEKHFRPVFDWVKDRWTGKKVPSFSGFWTDDGKTLYWFNELPDDAILDVVWEEEKS